MKKRKFIVFILVFLISFHAISIETKKEPQAILLSTAIIYGGVSLAAVGGFAALAATNGWHMQISDAVAHVANTFYDKQGENYVAKEGKVNALEKLTYWTSAKLSGNDVMDMTELNQVLRDNQPVSQVNNIPEMIDLNYNSTLYNGYLTSSSIENVFSSSYIQTGSTSAYYPIKDEYKGKTVKLNLDSNGNYVYIHLGDYGVVQNYTISWPRVKVITPNNQTMFIDIANYWGFKIEEGLLNFYAGKSNFYFKNAVSYSPIEEPIEEMVVEIIPDSPAAQPDTIINDTNINYYDLVSGKGRTIEEILGRMQTDQTLISRLLDRMDSQAYGDSYSVAQPTVNPITGVIEYGVTVPDSTDSDRLWGIGSILQKIYDAVLEIPGSVKGIYERALELPEDIARKIGALWNDVILPELRGTWNATTQQILDIYNGIIALPEDIANSIGTWWNDVVNPAWTQFFDDVRAIPGTITGAITTWWDNTLVPSIDAIRDKVLEIPTTATTWWDTAIDVPLESIQFDKLHLNGVITKFPFSIPFDYVKVLKQMNRPAVAPDLNINLSTSYFSVAHEIQIEPINKYIAFFRWFVLLTFLYALMMITRKVIKW